MSAFYDLHVLRYPVYDVVWFFFLFSVLGVVVEMVFCFARTGVIESRLGVLYLPLSPIYGIGGVSLGLFLLPFVKQPLLMFFLGMLVGSVLEYVASFVMEKLFHTVFWDYSDKPLNIHGRVCLQYSVYWGLLAMLLLYAVGPLTLRFVELFSRATGDVVLTVAIVLTVPSVVLTLAAFSHLQHKLTAIQHHQPLPSGPGARLVEALAPDVVVINTFPRMSLVVEYCQATGEQRKWIHADLHLGKVPAIHQRLQAALAAGAQQPPSTAASGVATG